MAVARSRLRIVRLDHVAEGGCERWRLCSQVGHTNCFVSNLLARHASGLAGDSRRYQSPVVAQVIPGK
jgi:hypothetical protein